MSYGPKIDGDVLEVFFNGTFVNGDVLAPSYPLRNPSWKTAQGYLADSVINSFLEAASASAKPIDVSDIASKAGVYLMTDDFATALPMIITKYGSGKNVSLSVTVENDGQCTISQTGAGINGNVFVNL